MLRMERLRVRYLIMHLVISDASDEYYEYVANELGLFSWYDQKLRNLISRAVGFHAYTSKDITVYKNETTHITHEFPYTYI